DRRLRGVPAVRPVRRGHRVGDRLGPERARRDGLMRLGLLGLGRIGAFHAETLTSLRMPVADAELRSFSNPLQRRSWRLRSAVWLPTWLTIDEFKIEICQ